MKIRTTNILDYVGLIINYLMKRRVLGTKRGLYGYPYLEHLIKLGPVDWAKQIEK